MIVVSNSASFITSPCPLADTIGTIRQSLAGRGLKRDFITAGRALSRADDQILLVRGGEILIWLTEHRKSRAFSRH